MTMEYISSTEDVIEFRDLIDWIAAIDAWDYCDGSLLADLILKHDIPLKLKPIVASIISGKRLQKKKAAASMRLPANERMYIAQAILTNLDLIDTFKTVKTTNGESLIEWHAARNSIEPIDSKRWLEKQARDIKVDASRQLGVSVETIDNLLRDFKKKLNNFPHV